MSSPTWIGSDDYLPQRQPKGMDWVRIARRGIPGVLVIAVCLILLLLVRLIERPLFGQRRPVTPFITCFVCRSVIWLIGFQYEVKGQPMEHPGAVVANHASWLDIFTLNAPQSRFTLCPNQKSRVGRVLVFWPKPRAPFSSRASAKRPNASNSFSLTDLGQGTSCSSFLRALQPTATAFFRSKPRFLKPFSMRRCGINPMSSRSP